MKKLLNIPDTEAGLHDNFQDFFKRLRAEVNSHMICNTNLVCGPCELETIEILLEAFKKSESPESVTEFADRCRLCGKTKRSSGLSINEIKQVLDECKLKDEMATSDNDVKSKLLISHVYSSVLRALMEYDAGRM